MTQLLWIIEIVEAGKIVREYIYYMCVCVCFVYAIEYYTGEIDRERKKNATDENRNCECLLWRPVFVRDIFIWKLNRVSIKMTQWLKLFVFPNQLQIFPIDMMSALKRHAETSFFLSMAIGCCCCRAILLRLTTLVICRVSNSIFELLLMGSVMEWLCIGKSRFCTEQKRA